MHRDIIIVPTMRLAKPISTSCSQCMFLKRLPRHTTQRRCGSGCALRLDSATAQVRARRVLWIGSASSSSERDPAEPACSSAADHTRGALRARSKRPRPAASQLRQGDTIRLPNAPRKRHPWDPSDYCPALRCAIPPKPRDVTAFCTMLPCGHAVTWTAHDHAQFTTNKNLVIQFNPSR